MSISGALSNALSGLTTASRATQIVSDNVSNARTEGYGPRELVLSPRIVGGAGAGVQVEGVNRAVDQGILQDRRLSDAAFGFASGRSEAASRLSDLAGTPDDPQSIAGRLRAFESALLEAGSRPDSDARLAQVLSAAKSLAAALDRASDGVQDERLAADASIAVQVDRLNTGLRQIDELNAQIVALSGQGRDVTGLQDQRQRAIDQIAEIVPLRTVPREGGSIALYTAGGTSLLEATPREIEFSPVNIITPDMTLASGALSGLTIDGRPAVTDGDLGGLAGGTLAAAFDLRDSAGPEAQARLDSFARDLLERFADPALDPTTLATDPGLFTDRGSAFDPLDEVGLAGRLTVNGAVDPAAGGELRRLRDGLGSALPGDVGNAALLYAYADALDAQRVPSSTAIASAERSAFGLASDLSSRFGVDAETAAQDQSFAAARQTALQALELERGVDTDKELRDLLLIEQVYAANARVVQTIDGLIDEILRI